MIRKTSAMVEAGILAAIAIVFAIISMYVPVIGSFINFLWPLPIAICGMRNGLRWSVMTLIVADIAVAVLISPLHAFSLLAAFGLVGLTLGECMRRGYKPFKLMLISSVACLISIGASFLIALYIMGIQPVDMMFTSLEEAARESVGYYQSMGMSQTEIDAAVKSNAEMLRMMRLIMPGAFFLCAPIIAFVNYLAARKILSKLGAAFEEFPPFTQWNVPGWMLWPYGISLLMVSYYVQYPESLMYHISVNLQVITSVFFVLQGIALIYWWLEKTISRNGGELYRWHCCFLSRYFLRLLCLWARLTWYLISVISAGKGLPSAHRDEASICLTKFGIRAVISYR